MTRRSRLGALVAAAVLVLSLTACEDQGDEDVGTDGGGTEQDGGGLGY